MRDHRQPSITRTTQIDIPPVSKQVLANGTKVYVVNLGTQRLVQVEIMWRGGRLQEHKKGVSRAACRLMKEGTSTMTAAEVSEHIDFYGANISTGANLDYSFAKLFFLQRYQDEVLPIFEEVIHQPAYTPQELAHYQEQSIQKLLVEQSKSELVAYRTLTEQIYGADHVYGYNSSEEVYHAIDVSNLVTYHDQALGDDNRVVIISGHADDEVVGKIITMLESTHNRSAHFEYQEPQVDGVSHRVLESEDQFQTAIKIGRRLFDRQHEDFDDMFVVNAILGGYFGSRLMTSLREEKGYTYNIYSAMDMMIYDGYFHVSTEVGNDYVQATVAGIYEEIERLQNDLVSSSELEMVRNYLSGNFLNMIDGPFKVASMMKVLALNDMQPDFYHKIMARIHSITSEDIRLIAQRYLQREAMSSVLVGNF